MGIVEQFWLILYNFGTLWNTFGTLWNTLAHYSTLGNILTHQGTIEYFRNTTVYTSFHIKGGVAVPKPVKILALPRLA